MKAIILGARGMLGSDLRKVFADKAPYVLDKDELDITSREAVFCVVNRLRPDVIINAAAYTDVDGCETNRELAMNVNGKAPGYLAEAASRCGAVLAHYSTDYVFQGEKTEGYSEGDSPRTPLNFYGETKLAGENAIKEVGGKYYLIRTSWLFGHGGPKVNGRPRNFIETMLRLAAKGEEIRVVNDQHGKPTFSLDLAKKTKELLDGNYEFGIYHAVNEPATTWYDFACEIFERSSAKDNGVNCQLPIVNCRPCTSAEFPRPSKRPHYSILLNTKLEPLRPWPEALEEYLTVRKLKV